MEFGIIILSGGKSSRFGSDKGLYIFNGRFMVEYAINIAQEFSNNIIISANQKEYQQFGIPVVADIYKNIGPMGGLFSALSSIKSEINLILPCDSPFISTELINLLIENYNNEEVLVFKTPNEKLHPLIGFYHKKIIDSLLDHIQKKKLKLIDFILSRPHKIIEITENDSIIECFQNFNFEEDLRNYKKTIQ